MRQLGSAVRAAGVMVWTGLVAGSQVRPARRDETGGISDETAMIAIMVVAAVMVGGIVFGVAHATAEGMSIELPGTG